MIKKPINGGMFDSISYLVGDKGKALLIDAGVKSEKVLSIAKELDLTIEKIILTHGHIDHVVELDNICEQVNAKVYIHANDEMSLSDARYNVSAYTGKAMTFECKSETLRDSSIINLGELEFKIIHTPGHTPGSICIEIDNNLFSGDTLFNSGYGRVDLPNGSFEEIYKSIVEKLFVLPIDMVVYPGHGSSTTIGKEKSTNPIKSVIEW
jgi:glyoxylase-like metal-dependent hydrolase (beta-lactamase superfamily II)